MGLLDFFSQKQHLQFNAMELSAIIKLAKVMAAADGHTDVMEIAVMANEAKRFGIPKDDFKMILSTSDAMEPSDSIMMVKAMDTKRKKYVAAYLGCIMAIDGDIDDKELAFWQLVSTLADLPTMSINEAVNYMSEL